MDKYARYYGIIAFLIITVLTIYGSYSLITPKVNEVEATKNTIISRKNTLEEKQRKVTTIKNKLKDLKNSIASSQKKIYSPSESDLGNDTLFFTLYKDVIEMVHSNSIKIKAIDYTHYPENDKFLTAGKDVYFVCNIDLELVSNFVNLGKLIQDIYQYPYYIKINNLEVKPYEKDKKILLTNLSLRLYSHTEPQAEPEALTE